MIPARARRKGRFGEEEGPARFVREGDSLGLSSFSSDMVGRSEGSKGDRVGVEVVKKGAIGLVSVGRGAPVSEDS